MKHHTSITFQGDVALAAIDSIPEGLEPVLRENGKLIVTHSETGHHHVFAAPGAELWRDPADPMVCYLRLSEPAELEHLRAWDTHESVMFPAGDYIVSRQREATPEGYRMVQD